jgi:DNA-binding response OmpR family regulator
MSDSAGSTPAVLVVEDQESVRKLVCLALRWHGHRAWTAASDEEAVRALRAHAEIDAAFIDINLPGMNGVATLTALLDLKPTLSCCLMGGDLWGQESELRAAGAAEILPKPFTLGDLTATVGRLMRRPTSGA